VYWKDHRETAYINKAVLFLIIGIISVIPVALIELFLMKFVFGKLERVMFPEENMGYVFVSSFIMAFLVASLVEETCKYLMAFFIPLKQQVIIFRVNPNISEHSLQLCCLQYVWSLGFSNLREYVVHISSFKHRQPCYGDCDNCYASPDGSSLACYYRFVFGMKKIFTDLEGVLIGCDMAKNRYQVQKKNYFQVLFVPFLIHGCYDFFTMFPSAYVAAGGSSWIELLILLSVVSVIVGVLYAKHQRAQVLQLPSNPVELNAQIV
jgi:hypothetical protein